MKKRLLLILFVISTLSGCTHDAQFYPVQGPLSTKTPAPAISAKITGRDIPSDISIVLSDGEVCKGHWEMVNARHGAATVNTANTSDLSSVWDAVYGAGFYVSDVLGSRRYARAVASGNRGTIINVEIYSPEVISTDEIFTLRVKGVAKDNKGNIYKVVL